MSSAWILEEKFIEQYGELVPGLEYKNVGNKHHWVDRLVWTDQKWIKYISDKKVKTGDVLQITLPDMKIKTVLEFKKGAQALITGGSHVGSISKIKDIEITRSTKPNLVMYDEFQTIKPYSFVVGEKKAMVALPEVKV